MKRNLHILCLCAFLSVLAGCAETETTSAVENSHETSNITETAVAPITTPAATPNRIYEDREGNYINPDGWEIQEMIPKETERSTATGKTKKGKTVKYNLPTITPANKAVAMGTPTHEMPDLEWRITEVEEMSGSDGKIFCYAYRAIPFPKDSNANGIAEVTRYRLCDYDGDGKYEFNGWSYVSFVIPDWVKSL